MIAGSAKDKHGVSESFSKETCLFAKNGRSRIKDFDQLILILTELIDVA
jgi:hypothetical protein